MFFSLIFLVSCQKEKLHNNYQEDVAKEKEMVNNVKKYYDIVKAANKDQIIERDGISFTLDDALLQIQALLSYTYSDFSTIVDSTYTFVDTIVINYSAIPIGTSDFCIFNKSNNGHLPNTI